MRHARFCEIVLCLVKKGQNGNSCKCRLVRSALAHCPCNLCPTCTHEGACTRFTSPQHVAYRVCASLYTLGNRGLTTNWTGSYIMYGDNSTLVPAAVYSLGKRNRKSITSVVAYIRFVTAFSVNGVQQMHQLNI